jgi:guanylate kinase
MTAIARRGLCLVLSAPSGAGKTAVARGLVALEPRLRLSVSATTRLPRAGEVEGADYFFLSEAAFAAAEQGGGFLESARVLDGAHAYGTPRPPVEQALAAGQDVVFDIDWQGHRQLRTKLPDDVVGVFILPPSLRVLEERLRTRAGDDPADIARRMRRASAEIAHWQEFDHVLVNDTLAGTIAAVRAILHAARLATARQTGLADFVARLG